MIIQSLAYIVLLFVIICSFFDYKKTVIIWFPVQLLFNAQIAIRYSAPALSLVLAVDVFLLFAYFIKGKRLRNMNKEPFVLYSPMVLIAISYLLSLLFGTIQASSGFTTMIKYFASGFGMVFLAQKVLNTNDDLRIFIKSSIVVCILISVLGLSESILKDNLWLDFVYFNSPNDASTVGRMFYIPPSISGGIEMRYGMVRARSFFGIHIAYGYACLMYLWTMMVILRNKWMPYSRKYIIITVCFLCAGVFMANAKTGYLGLVILIIGLYPLSKLLNVKMFLPLILMVVVVMTYFPQYINNFYSLFDAKLAEEGGGSTVAGREIQFRTAMNMFEMNPIFGNGPGSISVLKAKGNYGNILGAESSLMQILPERGIFGLIAYFYLYIYIYKKMKRLMPIKLIISFILALIVMEVATGILDLSIWGVVLIAARRLYQISYCKNGIQYSETSSMKLSR